MPRSRVKESPTFLDDAHRSTGSPDYMERGGHGQPPGSPAPLPPQQQGGDVELRVTVAATEERDEEGDNREREARNHRLLARVVVVALQALIVGFAGFFVYAWVNFLHKVSVCQPR